MKSGVFLLLVCCLLSACTDGIYPQLGRPLADPVILSPEVESFTREGANIIRWEPDPCADEYLVYRRPDSPYGVSEIVYRGKGVQFTDTDGRSQERYLYSLSKVRGLREFGPSSPVLGIFANVTADFCEPNNTKGDASRLESDLEAISYYYQDSSGQFYQMDEDWYYVEVPARKVASLLLVQTGLESGETFFNFAQEGEVPFKIENNNDFPVENYSYETRRFYFKICPIVTKFLGIPDQPGGGVVGYTLSLHMITNL